MSPLYLNEGHGLKTVRSRAFPPSDDFIQKLVREVKRTVDLPDGEGLLLSRFGAVIIGETLSQQF